MEIADLIISNGHIVTLNPSIFAPGAIAIRGETILAVGPEQEIVEKFQAGQKIDAAGRLVMPGMINAHMHLYSTFARGMAISGPSPTNFLEILERLWWRLDKALTPEDIRYSALIGAIQAICCGTTLLFDHHASPLAIDGSLDIVSEALTDVGLRGMLCYEVSDRDGIDMAKAGIRENLRFINQSKHHPQIKGMFGLHAAFTLNEKTLEACSDGNAAGFHIHVAEDASDQAISWHFSRERVVARLYRHGILGPRTLAAHAVHINETEMDILRQTQTRIIHNPESNMNNAVGTAPIQRMIQKGNPVGIGTDGMSANMFPALMTAVLLARHTQRDPQAGWMEAEAMFAQNRLMASSLFSRPLGILAPGALADIIIVDYLPPTPLISENFFGNLLFGLSHARVKDTIVHGQIVLKDGIPTRIDPAEITERARTLAAKLWQRLA